MAYLEFSTKDEALLRADQEGILQNYWYHRTNEQGVKNETGTRYKTYPELTASDTWVLNVTDYTLTEEETDACLDTVTLHEYPV